jgi:hypothetical protein
MKICALFVTLLLVCSVAYSVTVDGYCYLDHQWNNAGTQVKFLKVSPSAVTDSVFTDAAGYFTKVVVPGIYTVVRSHTLYKSDTLFSQVFTSSMTLANDTLYRPLSGNLRGCLGPGVFRVRGNLTIQAGDTLQIEPATKLLFDSLYFLDVYGTLTALGAETDSITFTVGRKTNINGLGTFNWRGLRILEGGARSSLDYCIIEESLAPDSCWGIYCRNSSPSISHSTIRHCSGYYNYGNVPNGGVRLNCSSPTFASCNIDSNGGGYGHGVDAIGNGNPLFTSCAFRCNTASGVWAQFGGSVELSHCDFSGNLGVGVYCYQTILTASNCQFVANGGGLSVWDKPCTIRNCEISSNRGGGIGCGRTNGTFDSCTVTQNTGTGVGCNGPNTSPTFSNCTISRNISRNGYGGGVNCQSYATPRFVECSIDSNQSITSVYYSNGGAGVYCSDSAAPVFENCTLIRDSTTGNGGAAFVDRYSSPSFIGCTMFGCDATGGGSPAAVYIRDSSPIFNGTIVSNSRSYGVAFDGDCRNSQIAYCDVYGNAFGNLRIPDAWIAPPALGQLLVTNVNGDSADIYMNIFEEPMFADTAHGNVNLLPGSPCVDAGDPSLPLDPDGTIADIGSRVFVQDLTASVKSLTFGDIALGETATRTVTLHNRTDNPISLAGVISHESVFTHDYEPGSGVLNPGDSLIIRVTFTPLNAGSYAGHLLITSNAAYNDSLIVTLTGMGGLIPAPVHNLTMQVAGADAHLYWSPVDTTIHGNPLNVDAYLVYFAERMEGPYWFLAMSTDTACVHQHVAQFASAMYYQVTAFVGSVQQLRAALPTDGVHMTSEEIAARMKLMAR